MSTPVDLNDRPSLLRAASTSLNSKVIISNRHYFEQQLISCSITDCVAIFIDVGSNCGCSRNSSGHTHRQRLTCDIWVVKKVGGTIKDTELIDGVVLNQNVVVAAGGPTRMEKAKIAIISVLLNQT
jgi:T-complex protein 1 subunit delta